MTIVQIKKLAWSRAGVAFLLALVGCSASSSGGAQRTGGLIFGHSSDPAAVRPRASVHPLDGDDDDDDDNGNSNEGNGGNGAYTNVGYSGGGEDSYGSTANVIGEVAQGVAEGLGYDGPGAGQIARDAALNAASEGADDYGQGQAAIGAMNEEINAEVAQGYASQATGDRMRAAMTSAITATVSEY